MTYRNRLVSAFAIAIAYAAMSGASAQGEPVRPVPLGGNLPNQSGDLYFGVYVPTKYGGTLTLRTTAGRIEELKGPNGLAHENGADLVRDAQGWHTFRIAGAAGPYTVSSTFEQNAKADRVPWNYYYWPTKGDAINEPWNGANGRVDTYQVRGDDILVATGGGSIAPGQDIIRPGRNGKLDTPVSRGDESTWFPNLYDDLFFQAMDGSIYQTPAPLLKYDQLFSAYSRAWEAANSQNQDIQRWPGHCLGAAVASIMLNEPQPAPGSGLTIDELKGLWAELGENHLNHRIGEHAADMPAGPPRPGPDSTDLSVAKFHAMLEDFVRGRRKALLANLRAFPPQGGAGEVWNHGVGKYEAAFESVSQTELRYRVKLKLYGSAGANLNNSDNKPRINTYEYIVTYGADGKANESANWGNDWIAVGGEAMYCPLNLLEIAESRWAGHNPFVNEANVRMLDLANGGANGRFASSQPPKFRNVAEYEANNGAALAASTPSNSAGAFNVGSSGSLNLGTPYSGNLGSFLGPNSGSMISADANMRYPNAFGGGMNAPMVMPNGGMAGPNAFYPSNPGMGAAAPYPSPYGGAEVGARPASAPSSGVSIFGGMFGGNRR